MISLSFPFTEEKIRALKVGDFVSIGEVMGVVKEMSALSTKIINMRNEEVTIPNAVLVGSAIKNYTGAFGGEDYTVLNLSLDVTPVKMRRPFYEPLTAAPSPPGGTTRPPRSTPRGRGVRSRRRLPPRSAARASRSAVKVAIRPNCLSP